MPARSTDSGHPSANAQTESPTSPVRFRGCRVSSLCGSVGGLSLMRGDEHGGGLEEEPRGEAAGGVERAAPRVDRIEPAVAELAARCPAWGHREIWPMGRYDGWDSASPPTARRAMELTDPQLTGGDRAQRRCLPRCSWSCRGGRRSGFAIPVPHLHLERLADETDHVPQILRVA